MCKAEAQCNSNEKFKIYHRHTRLSTQCPDTKTVRALLMNQVCVRVYALYLLSVVVVLPHFTSFFSKPLPLCFLFLADRSCLLLLVSM